MKLPRIALYTFVIAFFVLLFITMKELQFYLVPATFGALLAMLMLPFNRLLERWRFPRILSIVISLLVILSVVFLIASLFTAQVMSFADDFPTIEGQLTAKFADLQRFIAEKTGINNQSQSEFLDKELKAFLQSADKVVTGILVSTGGTLAALGLMLLHFFLFLLYRGRIKQFFLQILPETGHNKAEHVIEQITKVTQQYLTGVVTVMAILSVINSLGFLALGIQNAIFFGILAAVLNIVPYIGVWIGSALPILMALVTKDSIFYAIGVIIVILIAQFLDNNFLTPRITGSQVKINALATIGVILVGSLTWGVGGMILFIPLLGMAKIVFDNVDQLKPFGYLIGDDDSSGDSAISKIMGRAKGKKAVK